MWKQFVEMDRPQIKTRRKRMACRIPTATNTHSKYVILVIFMLQEWIHERASMLHVHCLCCYYLTYSIPFKLISSLPNQR